MTEERWVWIVHDKGLLLGAYDNQEAGTKHAKLREARLQKLRVFSSYDPETFPIAYGGQE